MKKCKFSEQEFSGSNEHKACTVNVNTIKLQQVLTDNYFETSLQRFHCRKRIAESITQIYSVEYLIELVFCVLT